MGRLGRLTAEPRPQQSLEKHIDKDVDLAAKYVGGRDEMGSAVKGAPNSGFPFPDMALQERDTYSRRGRTRNLLRLTKTSAV